MEDVNDSGVIDVAVESVTPVEESTVKPEVSQEVRGEIITEFMDSLGSFILLQFDNPTSVIHNATFSTDPPSGAAVIAALEGLLRQYKIYEEAQIQAQRVSELAEIERIRQSKEITDKKARARILVPR